MLEGSNGVGDDEFSVCERMLFCCRCLKRCSWWTQTTRKTAAEEEAEEEADEGLLASSTMTFALSG